MPRSLYTDPAKSDTLKPKGRRKGRTLDPDKQARKRANDRESQRKLRTRTKNYIAHMEQELARLKDRQSRDHTIQELQKRNEAAEKELLELKESLRLAQDALTHSQQSQCHQQQMSGTDVFLTSHSDGIGLFASVADASSDFYHSQKSINQGVSRNSGANTLMTNLWEDCHNTSLHTPIPGPSITNYFPQYISCSPDHPTAPLPGSSDAIYQHFDSTCPHPRVKDGVARDSTDTFPAQMLVYMGQNGTNYCNPCHDSRS